MNQSPSPNKLINATSPYLKQHAHNPVQWYPWGKEALDKARTEDKPLIISIGYSACHWCHVMERESFENHEIAEVMNEGFVCIKVDREERPDIDQVYMEAMHPRRWVSMEAGRSMFLRCQTRSLFVEARIFSLGSGCTF
jgi:uncharacterized protein YyaL (SSP411 family)